VFGTKNGFTLVELLIAFGIVAVLIGALYPAFGDFGKKQAVVQAVENFKNDLEVTQLKSISGVTAGGLAVEWAISIDCSVAGGAKEYSLGYFSGATFTSKKTESLGHGISVDSCGNSGVIFEKTTGKVGGVVPKTFIFSSSNVSGFSKTLTLEERGHVVIQ
jgi:prepilin-type N-terminal cleavage/methylation domain-containing protein